MLVSKLLWRFLCNFIYICINKVDPIEYLLLCYSKLLWRFLCDFIDLSGQGRFQIDEGIRWIFTVMALSPFPTNGSTQKNSQETSDGVNGPRVLNVIGTSLPCQLEVGLTVSSCVVMIDPKFSHIYISLQ